MNDQGDFLDHKDFYVKYNLNCSISECNNVMKAISPPFKSVTQQLVLNANIFVLRTLSVDGNNFLIDLLSVLT